MSVANRMTLDTYARCSTGREASGGLVAAISESRSLGKRVPRLFLFSKSSFSRQVRIAALVLLALSFGAAAADVQLDQLSQVQQELMLLKAELEKSKAEVEQKKAEAEKNKAAVEEGRSQVELNRLQIELSAGPAGWLPDPMVKAVYGRGSQLIALFELPGGGSMEAKKGDHLPGGYTVAEVSVSAVSLRKKGKRIDALFSSPSQPVKPGSSSPMPGMPPRLGGGMMMP